MTETTVHYGDSIGDVIAALRAENARLTAALSVHQDTLRCGIETLDKLWAAIGDRLCAQGPLDTAYGQAVAREVREARDTMRRALAVPTGSEAAARVQALQRTLGHLVTLVLQTSTDQDVLDIARGVTIEYVDGEPQAAL